MLSGFICRQQLHFLPCLATVWAGSSAAGGSLCRNSQPGLADLALTRSRPMVAGPVFTSGLHAKLLLNFEASEASRVGGRA